MEIRIKRQDTRRASTVLFVTLNKKIHTVSAVELHCALSTEYSESGECTQHSVHNKSSALTCTQHSVQADLTGTCTQCHRLIRH